MTDNQKRSCQSLTTTIKSFIRLFTATKHLTSCVVYVIVLIVNIFFLGAKVVDFSKEAHQEVTTIDVPIWISQLYSNLVTTYTPIHAYIYLTQQNSINIKKRRRGN